jgi:NADH-quinone oxidoreductase subunit M
MMSLNLLWVWPLTTALVMLAARTVQQTRVLALIGATCQLLLAGVLWYQYQALRTAGNTAAFLFEEKYTWYEALHIGHHTGADGMSVAMIVLTAVVVLAGVLVSWRQKTMGREFFFLLIFLSIGAYGFFISLDLFTLFFFLELAVVPKFLLIGIWGSGQKNYSAMKLALLLMGGSALILVGMVGLYYNAATPGFDMPALAASPISIPQQRFFFPFLFVGFGVFTALFPFHTWVPDGHSSAPTAASMFLAGISMKLGGYGCLRVAVWLMPDAAQEYSWLIVLLSAIAILYGAFATMMQTDLKYINAYSSISHCGFVLLGIGMLTQTAVTGAILQMVSHGLMTALFFAVIGMVYERTHTRQVAQLGGLLKIMPFISVAFVIAGLCSLGLPGLSGFVAEMTVFIGAWQRQGIGYHLATLAAAASIVVTAVYILRAVGKVIMGPVAQQDHLSLKDARWNERLAALLLLAGVFAIGLIPAWLSNLTGEASAHLLQQILKP